MLYGPSGTSTANSSLQRAIADFDPVRDGGPKEFDSDRVYMPEAAWHGGICRKHGFSDTSIVELKHTAEISHSHVQFHSFCADQLQR